MVHTIGIVLSGIRAIEWGTYISFSSLLFSSLLFSSLLFSSRNLLFSSRNLLFSSHNLLFFSIILSFRLGRRVKGNQALLNSFTRISYSLFIYSSHSHSAKDFLLLLFFGTFTQYSLVFSNQYIIVTSDLLILIYPSTSQSILIISNNNVNHSENDLKCLMIWMKITNQFWSKT